MPRSSFWCLLPAPSPLALRTGQRLSLSPDCPSGAPSPPLPQPSAGLVLLLSPSATPLPLPRFKHLGFSSLLLSVRSPHGARAIFTKLDSDAKATSGAPGVPSCAPQPQLHGGASGDLDGTAPGPAGGRGTTGISKPSRGFSSAGPDHRLSDEPGSLVWRTDGHPRLARPGPRPHSPAGTPPENSLPRGPQMCHVLPALWALRCCATSRNTLRLFSKFKHQVCRKLPRSASGWHHGRHHPLQNELWIVKVVCRGGKNPALCPKGRVPQVESERRGWQSSPGASETLSSAFSSQPWPFPIWPALCKFSFGQNYNSSYHYLWMAGRSRTSWEVKRNND